MLLTVLICTCISGLIINSFPFYNWKYLGQMYIILFSWCSYMSPCSSTNNLLLVYRKKKYFYRNKSYAFVYKNQAKVKEISGLLCFICYKQASWKKNSAWKPQLNIFSYTNSHGIVLPLMRDEFSCFVQNIMQRWLWNSLRLGN